MFDKRHTTKILKNTTLCNGLRLYGMIAKVGPLNRAVNKIITILLPHEIARAGCGTAYYCGTTFTGQYCMNGCFAYQGQCRILKQKRVYIWKSDTPTCAGMCIVGTACAAISVGNTCSPPCPT